VGLYYVTNCQVFPNFHQFPSTTLHQFIWIIGFSEGVRLPPKATEVPLSAVSMSATFIMSLTPCSRVLLEKLISFQLVKKFPTFLEPESLLSPSQVPATCPYPEPARSSHYVPVKKCCTATHRTEKKIVKLRIRPVRCMSFPLVGPSIMHDGSTENDTLLSANHSLSLKFSIILGAENATVFYHKTSAAWIELLLRSKSGYKIYV